MHAWGDTLKEAFEQCAMAMFGLMTDLERVEINEVHDVEAEGFDMMSLLYNFLDELLFMFCAEPYLVAKVIQLDWNNKFSSLINNTFNNTTMFLVSVVY